MKFKKNDLLDVLVGDIPEGFDIIHDKIIDTSRWAIQHELVFSYENKFYRTYYQVGATEYQDESPFEYDGDEIECAEVVPVVKTAIIYEKA